MYCKFNTAFLHETVIDYVCNPPAQFKTSKFFWAGVKSIFWPGTSFSCNGNTRNGSRIGTDPEPTPEPCQWKSAIRVEFACSPSVLWFSPQLKDMQHWSNFTLNFA